MSTETSDGGPNTPANASSEPQNPVSIRIIFPNPRVGRTHLRVDALEARSEESSSISLNVVRQLREVGNMPLEMDAAMVRLEWRLAEGFIKHKSDFRIDADSPVLVKLGLADCQRVDEERSGMERNGINSFMCYTSKDVAKVLEANAAARDQQNADQKKDKMNRIRERDKKKNNPNQTNDPTNGGEGSSKQQGPSTDGT